MWLSSSSSFTPVQKLMSSAVGRGGGGGKQNDCPGCQNVGAQQVLLRQGGAWDRVVSGSLGGVRGWGEGGAHHCVHSSTSIGGGHMPHGSVLGTRMGHCSGLCPRCQTLLIWHRLYQVPYNQVPCIRYWTQNKPNRTKRISSHSSSSFFSDPFSPFVEFESLTCQHWLKHFP